MDVKKGYREVEDKARELGREVDGHDVGDDIGNAGDAERQGDVPDDEPLTNDPYKDEPR